MELTASIPFFLILFVVPAQRAGTTDRKVFFVPREALMKSTGLKINWMQEQSPFAIQFQGRRWEFQHVQ